MIRRVVIPTHGDENVLEVRSGPPPALEPGGVRIRVSATGVNFADLLMRMGMYPEAPPRPFVPGYEVAGTVAEISEEASRARPALAPGQRVLAITRFGGYAEEVVVPAAKVYPLPEGWSFEQGAAFPVVFLTAWTGLVPMARVREGDRVLIHGIAGGTGMAGLQIALAAGARVAGTCGGVEKGKAALELGAERVIDYRSEHVPAVVREWAGDGVDVIMEPRAGKSLRESLGLLAPAGRLVAYGMSDAVGNGRKRNLFRFASGVLPLVWLSMLRLVKENIGVFGLNVLRLWDRDELLSRAMSELLGGVDAGVYRPNLDRTFPLERAAEAHRYLHDRRNVGKVVLTTGA